MNGKKVLIAEDEVHIAKLVEFILAKKGCVVTVANDGVEAVTELLRSKFDLVILDVMMPGKTGWEVLEAVRGNAGTPNHASPILMLTAKGTASDAAQAAQKGATDFFKKPFDPEELVKVVQRLLA